ncbi:MAG: CBS domain-containing protein [Bacteroidetes bacterium]|nr:MAG: CBS domain-containing protein [Bacteroidota bacterium]TNE97055.1 MAG: CBS domain-containing protein [Bacteroidota bacterium]
MNLDGPISNLMTTDVKVVSPDQLLVDLKHIYEQIDFHSHIPVVENDKLVGIVSLINFMHAIGAATLDDNEAVYQTKTVKDIMTLNPVTIPADATIRDAAKVLSSGNFHSIIVANNGEVKGIVTTTDIIRQLV